MDSLRNAIRTQATKLKQWFTDHMSSIFGGQKPLDQPMDQVSEIEFEQLFTLKKVEEKQLKKFTLTQTHYEIIIAPLNKYFNNVESVSILPKIFEAILNVCTDDFEPLDRIIIELECDGLDENIYLHVAHFEDYNIDTLLRQTEFINSSKKFKVDETFKIKITRVSNMQGGARPKHIHATVDRNRMSNSLVSVHVGSNLCLPASLYLGKFRMTHNNKTGEADYRTWKHLVEKQRTTRLEKLISTELLQHGFTVGKMFDLLDIDVLQKRIYTEFQIVVLSALHGNTVISRTPPKKAPGMQEIVVYYSKDHYDLITNLDGYLMKGKYCDVCEKAYKDKNKHRCSGTCPYCFRSNDKCQILNSVFCNDCQRKSRNSECYQIHKEPGKSGVNLCQQLFLCKDCRVFVNLTSVKKGTRHICGQFYCKTCKISAPQDHKCYIQPLKQEKIDENPNYIFFDIETYNDPVLGHVPNLIIAQRSDGTEYRFPPDFTDMKGDVTDMFCKWLFTEQNRGATLIAHNFKGYDGHFILKYMLSNNLKVKIIKRGTKILDLQYRKLKINARDTLNFVSSRLAEFPTTVGIDTISKGEFPHLLNKPENWDKILDFPSPEMYMIESRTDEQRRKFMEWYNAEKADYGGVFDFRSQIVKYCQVDVTVLRECTLKFRKDFIAGTKVDPFKSVTIAAACQRYYRTFHLQKDDVAVISGHGYQANRKTSVEATEWLLWKNSQTGGNIQHGRNGKEFKVGKYFVDGYDPITNTAYEYNGAVFHGCTCCTEPDDTVPFSRITMAQANEKHREKVAYLKKRGLKVEIMWSCDWKKIKVSNQTVSAFLKRTNLQTPLSIKDAFKGGRTNAFKMKHEVKPGETINYADVTSLYPYVNKYAVYPVGHPEFVLSDFKNISGYFGVVKCTVEAPDNLHFPVLPGTYNGKLVFTLCSSCVTQKNQDYCNHKGEQRYLHGTWCTPELNEAIASGYKIINIHEVWHWEHRREGYFADYINNFLKIKMEASGWPVWCETEEDKNVYIRQVAQGERIELDKEKVSSNPGLRAVAKLMLNSFWGKFGMRDNLTKTQFVYEPKKFYRLLQSKANKIHDIHIVTEECVMVTSSHEDEYNEGNNTSNIAIAAFTTCHARLHLLAMMRKLGDRVLYADTDSVIYVSRPGDWEPETGTMLGQWNNQLEVGESHITSFVSLGPKTYAYETNTGRIEIKAKGMTQNGYTENILKKTEDSLERTNTSLNKEKLGELLHNPDLSLPVLYPKQLKRDSKTQAISEVLLTKTLKLVYDKRIILADFSTRPYGERDTIVFSKHSKECGFLSNYYISEFTIENEKWNTVEAFYHAAKYNGKSFIQRGIRTSIRAAATPYEAKLFGSNNGVRSDWNIIKNQVMMEGLFSKFTQSIGLKHRLFATGDQKLVDTDDINNIVGILLMELREELKEIG